MNRSQIIVSCVVNCIEMVFLHESLLTKRWFFLLETHVYAKKSKSNQFGNTNFGKKLSILGKLFYYNRRRQHKVNEILKKIHYFEKNTVFYSDEHVSLLKNSFR